MTTSGPVSIAMQETSVIVTPRDIQALRREFTERHVICLKSFFRHDLLALLRQRLREARFVERSHGGIGSNLELCMDDECLSGMLHLLLNSETLFRFLQDVTGCGAIGCFGGRVYRVVPGLGHHDAWHGDWGETRMLALSVNLGESFEGGVLQMRNLHTQEFVSELPNPVPGDAILFAISRDLEHRITEVAGSRPKTALAGWFQAQPKYFKSIPRSHDDG